MSFPASFTNVAKEPVGVLCHVSRQPKVQRLSPMARRGSSRSPLLCVCSASWPSTLRGSRFRVSQHLRDPHTDAVLSGRVCERRSRHAHHRPNRHRQVSAWQDTSVNTGRPLRVNSSRYCSRSVDNSGATRMASHESSVSRHRRRIVSGRSFLFLPICRNGSIDRERNEGSQRLVVTIIARASGRYECI
jgi:hypothetical protein